MFCRSRTSVAGLLLALTSFGGASSCLYHAGDRCDPGQIYDANAGLCECDNSMGLVTGDHGCVTCGDHQVVKADSCQCADNYEMVGTACQPTTRGLACASDKDCNDAKYNACHILPDSGSYCTNTGCTDDTSCDGGYACNTSTDPAYCERPPTGDGQPCQSSMDCQGTDATFCESFKTKVCYVQGCSLTTNDCFGGKECCDLTGPSGGLFKTQICVVAGSCQK
jgi:hypothetical protein